MGLAIYEIVGTDGNGGYDRMGRRKTSTQTKESAFEAAVAAASLAIRQGHEVRVYRAGL